MVKLPQSVVRSNGAVFDQRRLDNAIAAHERFVRRAGGARAILRFARLAGLDLSRRRLSDAEFTGTVLRGAGLWGADLERASFYCADLRGCNFTEANLKRADLRGASLAGATLNRAVLDGADMRAAALAFTGMEGEALRHGRNIGDSPDEAWDAGLDPNRPGGFTAGSVDFLNASMRGVSLCDANLKSANFTGAILEGANFRGARLTGAVFDGAVLTGVRLDDLSLTRDQLRGCILAPGPEAMARRATLLAALDCAAQWVQSDGRRGAPAVMNDEDLRALGPVFQGLTLTAMSARRACGIDVDFSGCGLQGAAFDEADLRGANFEGADLRGASFRDAKLSHARFKDAQFGSLELSEGRRHAANFEGASLEGVRLDELPVALMRA